jgi:hypothetical protein
MTATQGVVGLSTQLKVATDTSPSDLQLVGEIGDIQLGGESVEFAEFTHQQSDGGYREFKPTFKNGGDVTFAFNWTNDAQQATLKAGYDSSDLMYFEIVYPNGMSHTFTAYVSQIGTSAPMNGPLRKNVTLRITGAIVEA